MVWDDVMSPDAIYRTVNNPKKLLSPNDRMFYSQHVLFHSYSSNLPTMIFFTFTSERHGVLFNLVQSSLMLQVVLHTVLTSLLLSLEVNRTDNNPSYYVTEKPESVNSCPEDFPMAKKKTPY